MSFLRSVVLTLLPRSWLVSALLISALLVSALLGCSFAACGVTLDDVAGRACDDMHPCRAGRACILGACRDVTDTDAGQVDAGQPGPDAGPVDSGVRDAGVPLWQQRIDGFGTRTQGRGCTADIDPSRGNRVLANVRSTTDAQDFATANVIDPARLPRGFDGHLRGRITLPAPLSPRGLMPLVALTDGTRALIEIGFTAQGRLFVLSAAQTLSDATLLESFTRDGGFPAGDVVVDVTWRRGGTREVSIDGVLVGSSLLGPASSTTPPAALHLGVLSTGIDGGAPFTVTLSGFQLADSPTVPLGDLP